MVEPPPTATNASHGPASRAYVDGRLEAGIGGFDAHAVEHLRLYPGLGHLVGDALGDSGCRDAAIGHQQHPARPQLAQVETDFVGGAGTELQLRCPVGEYRFGVGGKGRSHFRAPRGVVLGQI